MKFYLMRHGEAEAFAASDQDRILTVFGEQHLCEMMNSKKKLLAEVDCIIHSPYLRAVQTGKITARILGVDQVNSSALWSPDSDPHLALKSLENYVSFTPLVVSHMPLISKVESIFIGEKCYPRHFNCGEVSEISADWPAAGMGWKKHM